MKTISNKVKEDLFQSLINSSTAFDFFSEADSLIGYLNEVWSLRDLPSNDPRFTNAYDDVVMHMVNNDDWDLEYLFFERFNIFEDEYFYKALELLVHPRYQRTEDLIVSNALLINSYLNSQGVDLKVANYFDDLPVYQITEYNGKTDYSDVPQNSIPFFVRRSPSGRSDSITAHSDPEEYPAFVLAFNSGWNDWGYRTVFSLFYYDEQGEGNRLGNVKITNGKDKSTASILDDRFMTLPDGFCSLGQEYSYYADLRELFGRQFISVLYALKDVSFFSDIYESFESNDIFASSLIRFDDAERLMREVKHKLYGYDLNHLYSFKYVFTPPYSKESIDINFDFNNDKELPNRIFAIIGKNGTGKTQMITKLPLDISHKNTERFLPQSPLFSKIIAVSYSIFDDFEIPSKSSEFNYVYCGLSKVEKKRKVIRTNNEQLYQFHEAWKRIHSLGRMEKWNGILLSFIEGSILDSFIYDDPEKGLYVDRKAFNKTRSKLSSGQSILLFILTEIVSQIRLDSLILFDEPETHLHPNAISQLMGLIYNLVKEFDSYCIITTHSPIIIQELLSRNVYVMDREGDYPLIRKIGLESFGENLTVLTEEVFGNREIPKMYKEVIDDLVWDGYNYQEIKGKLESDGIALSLNARLYIKSKVSE